jgi:hypothetical protein
MVGRQVTRAALLLLGFLVVGCGSLLPAPPTPALDAGIAVDNDTDIPVTLAINEVVIGTVPAHSTASVPTATAPPKPWDIGARTPGGRGIVALWVKDAEASGVFVEMTCGDLSFGFGEFPKVPVQGDPPIPCEP